MMVTNLADILRGAGLKVIEVSGWKTRGHGGMSGVKGVLWHHTATSAKASGNYPSLNVVQNGRSDLPGPLANLGLGRDGTWYVIAAGLAYHAGTGSHPAIGTNNGNNWLLGVEAEHPGTAGNLWPAAQIDSYRRGTAALLRAFGLGSDRAIGHKEWAPSRKIDPYGLNMADERKFIQHYISNPTGNEDIDVATLNELFELVRKYSGGDSAFGYTLPRSPERSRTFAAAIPPQGGVVTGNNGRVYVSLVSGEDAEVAGVYAVSDPVADGVAGSKVWLQGKYTLKANDRQSWPLPGNTTHVCVVYKSDADLSLCVEIDAVWK